MSCLVLCVVCLLTFGGIESFLVDGGAQGCSSGPATCYNLDTNDPSPVVTLSNGLEVVCDTQTDGGGWIIIQRRASSAVDFYRNWDEYKYGFGDLKGNFWFGLEKVHQLTFKRRYELRVDLMHNNKDFYALYDSFTLFGEPENYKIRVSGYSGTAGDSLGRHNMHPFSTKDRDNDDYGASCAQEYHGAWWYDACHSSNLNGHWGDAHYGQGLDWHSTTGYNATVTFTEMKIRPILS